MSRSFVPLTLPYQQGGWGCIRSRKVPYYPTTVRIADPTDQRDNSDHTIFAQQQKLGKEEVGGTFELSSQVTIKTWCSLVFLKTTEHWPAVGEWWVNSLFFFLVCGDFTLSIILSLFQLTSFLIPILSCNLKMGSEWVAVWSLDAHWGLNHNNGALHPGKWKTVCEQVWECRISVLLVSILKVSRLTSLGVLDSCQVF